MVFGIEMSVKALLESWVSFIAEENHTDHSVWLNFLKVFLNHTN